MAPTPLLSKGNGTLARKWRKIKKRCSSFSSGDALARSKSQERDNIEGGHHQPRRSNHDQDEEEGEEGIAIGEPNATLNTDASKFRHLRDKLQQWNLFSFYDNKDVKLEQIEDNVRLIYIPYQNSINVKVNIQ